MPSTEEEGSWICIQASNGAYIRLQGQASHCAPPCVVLDDQLCDTKLFKTTTQVNSSHEEDETKRSDSVASTTSSALLPATSSPDSTSSEMQTQRIMLANATSTLTEKKKANDSNVNTTFLLSNISVPTQTVSSKQSVPASALLRRQSATTLKPSAQDLPPITTSYKLSAEYLARMEAENDSPSHSSDDSAGIGSGLTANGPSPNLRPSIQRNTPTTPTVASELPPNGDFSKAGPIFEGTSDSWRCCYCPAIKLYGIAHVNQTVLREECVASSPASCVYTSTLSECEEQLKSFACVQNQSCSDPIVYIKSLGAVPEPLSPTEISGFTSGVVLGLLAALCAAFGVGLYLVRRRRSFLHGPEPFILSLPPQYQIFNSSRKEVMSWKLDTRRLQISTAFSNECLAFYDSRAVWLQSIPCMETTTAQVHLYSRFSSPYIVSMIGWLHWNDGMSIAYEYMEYGDLKTFLSHSTFDFPWSQKRDCIVDIIQGLMYLHSLDLVHGNLRSCNILLNANMLAKLTCIGGGEEDAPESSFRWHAPEILTGGRNTYASDIYALGMIIQEMDSHLDPFRIEQDTACWTDSMLLNQISSNSLPDLLFSKSCPMEIQELAMQCISFDPSERPTAFELSGLLDQDFDSDSSSSYLYPSQDTSFVSLNTCVTATSSVSFQS